MRLYYKIIFFLLEHTHASLAFGATNAQQTIFMKSLLLDQSESGDDLTSLLEIRMVDIPLTCSKRHMRFSLVVN